MTRLLVYAALAAVAVAPAAAGEGRYIPRPPVIVSPDLTEPWILQYRPGGYGVVITQPTFHKNVILTYPTKRGHAHELAVTYGNKPVAVIDPPPGSRVTVTRTRSIDPIYLPRIVPYRGDHGPGTIVIDTNARFLYLVEGHGKARRYGVGVGRPGFEWAGIHTVTRKAEWPDWHPPAEMRKRQPYLPTQMAGGPSNPLGARALYLGSSLYRIHGSNEPWTIGQAVSSGCIRMRNEDVIDLYARVGVGTKVVVL